MKYYNSREYLVDTFKKTKPLYSVESETDLFAWQKKARTKLEELLMMPQSIPNDSKFEIQSTEETDEYKKICFEFQSEEGYFVPCVLLIPIHITKPLPTFICLQGHSTGKHISLGESKYEKDAKTIAGGRDFALQAVKNGYCAIAMDQRYMGDAGHKESGSPQCLMPNAVMPTLLFGRTAIGERVWDIQRLIDVMEKHLTEYVDTDKIACLGNSGGGTATFYASCLEERIYLSVPSCAVCTYDDSILAMLHCDCNYIPGIRKYFEMGDIGCLIAPRRLVMVSGAEDPIFPIEGAKKSFSVIRGSYEKLGSAELCHMVIGNGGHRFYPKEAWEVINLLLKERV